MAKRHSNPRLVKIHRSYTVEEAANLLAVHKSTVREWIKRGLPTSDDRRPTIILGRELAAFLTARRIKNKRPCSIGELYCLKCKAPKKPAGRMVDFAPTTNKVGNLTAICPDCETMMNRRFSLSKLGQFQTEMDITFPQALRHIVESDKPTVNHDFK
jgi:hypothetical protein